MFPLPGRHRPRPDISVAAAQRRDGAARQGLQVPRQAAQEFSDNVLRETEEALVKSLSEVKSTRQAVRAAGKSGTL